jgi:hypothetical protein
VRTKRDSGVVGGCELASKNFCVCGAVGHKLAESIKPAFEIVLIH